METKINVPVRVFVFDHSLTADVPGSVRIAGVGAKSRRALRDKVDAAMREAMERAETIRRIIGCTDGTVLLVERGGYAICGPGRTFACGTYGAPGDDWSARARHHAEQSYGGVAWEHSL